MAGSRPTPTPRTAKDLAKALAALGWRLDKRGSGHTMAFAPDGVGKVTLPSTASDARAVRNAVADARRAGADL